MRKVPLELLRETRRRHFITSLCLLPQRLLIFEFIPLCVFSSSQKRRKVQPAKPPVFFSKNTLRSAGKSEWQSECCLLSSHRLSASLMSHQKRKQFLMDDHYLDVQITILDEINTIKWPQGLNLVQLITNAT